MDQGFGSRLSATWDEKWPGDVPIGWLMRHYGRWVRFHSLDDSARPRSTEEKSIALERHLALTQEMHALTPTDSLVAFSYDWGLDELAGGPFKGFDYWRSFGPSDYFEGFLRVHVRVEPWTEPNVARLLRGQLDAREDLSLMLCGDSMDWLYASYDGGGDAVLSTTAQRDALYAKFNTWAAPWNHWHPITEWRGPDLRR